jgi:nitroimidazol reductase NimA-like FMN-containing flavoprotein (pyridoxamine 5'-phosphate oxidase superfamily)
MSTEASWAGGELVELSRAECRELLGDRGTGRVAFCDDDGQVVLPVHYVVTADGSIVFRTAPQSVMARRLDGARAVIQVDGVDDVTRSGWSVLVRGRSRHLDRDDLGTHSRPETWPGGLRSQLVAIALDTVTGRRLLPG